MRTNFGPGNTEADVEKQFVTPLLQDPHHLAIPETAVFSQESLRAYEINKGASRKLYKPDFTVYCGGVPVAVVEAKDPNIDIASAYAEAQLYAHQLNNEYRSGINPVKAVIDTNGRELLAGLWDQRIPRIQVAIKDMLVGSQALVDLQELAGWDSLQNNANSVLRNVTPTRWFFPAEHLGQNRVTLSKVGHNSLYPELDPLLRRYFNPADEAHEAEIVERAYVSSEDVTKYQKTFETYLRSRVVPLTDPLGLELKTAKRDAPDLTSRLNKASVRRSRPYMQLIIGGVGSGKTTFLKRYFRHAIPPSLDAHTAYCRLDLNEADDDLADLNAWICRAFVLGLRERYPALIDTDSEAGLRSVFAGEIRESKGAYSILKAASEEKYKERLAADLLGWLSDPEVFAREVARMVGGDMGLHLVVAFDNVDRRDRAAQLRIFQTGQWFMGITHATLIMTLRDETYEAYKDEKPLDAFPKNGNFYIRPPRFIDMVAKRLDLAMAYIMGGAPKILHYDIPGLGTVSYPDNALGQYLAAVSGDLFRRRRNITVVLEALAGKNARRALEMLTAVLTSAHFDTRDFTATILTAGSHRIQEPTLLRALMRTNYLYFSSSHGFVKNIFDFPPDCEQPSHFLKSEILFFLIDHRKKVGDINLEGYFTAGYLMQVFKSRGFVENDVLKTLNVLLKDELIMSDNLTRLDVLETTAVRIHPSGYVHMRILLGRLEYVSAAALVTPIADRGIAETIGRLWSITPPHLDISKRRKQEVATAFVKHLEDNLKTQRKVTAGLADQHLVGSRLVKVATDAIDGMGTVSPMETERGEFDRLFDN